MRRVNPVDLCLVFDGPIPLRSDTDFFVLHHIGRLGGLKASEIDAKVIHRWHKERGFLGCAYGYIILTDGTIQRGRKRDELGAHCKGHNYQSIGICVVGDFDNASPTAEQLDALARLLADLHDHFGLDAAREETILGHCDLNKTDCPGVNLYKKIPAIRRKVIELCK